MSDHPVIPSSRRKPRPYPRLSARQSRRLHRLRLKPLKTAPAPRPLPRQVHRLRLKPIPAPRPSPRPIHRLHLKPIADADEEQTMKVPADIANQQNQHQQEMKTEVSGAASSAGLLGLGSIIGSILKYVAAFLIQ